VQIKSIVNGSTPIPPSNCIHIDKDKLLDYGNQVEKLESEHKPIDTLRDYSLCGRPCDGDFCSKHIPALSQCSIINTIIPKNNIEKIKLVPCLKPCEGEYCSKHIPKLKCRVKLSDGSLCQEYCKLDSTVCYRHQEDKCKDQYKDVIPPWYVDLNAPYVPRFITGSIVDCCKSYKSSFGLFNNGHIDKFNISQRTKKDRYQSLVIEKTCFSSDNQFIPKYFGLKEPMKFGVFHTKHHKRFKFKQLQIKYDGRLIWDSKLDKWYYIYTSESKKEKSQHTENQGVLCKPSSFKRLIAIDLGIKTPGTGYSPNGHVLTLDIHQPTEDILAQIEKLTSLDRLSRHQKRTLKSLKRRYKYRNDMGGELYGYLLAQDRLRRRIEKTTNKTQKRMYWKVFYRLSNIIKNKVDDFHWRCIRYLIDNYDCISVGNLKIKQIIKCLTDSRQRKSVRILTVLRMSKFMVRLKEKCKEHQKVLHIQNEACTSKTCSSCGWYNENLGRSRTFVCLECNLVIDRDVNAARNIYLRSWLENGLEFRYPMHASAISHNKSDVPCMSDCPRHIR
jgi:putative transposase